MLEETNFDRLVAQAWLATHSEELGGWRLRCAEGVTKRADSVLPLAEKILTGVPAAYASADGLAVGRGVARLNGGGSTRWR